MTGTPIRDFLHRRFRDMEVRTHELNYLFWECTTRCNLHCRHCGSDCTAPGGEPDMPLEDFLRAFDTIPERERQPGFTVVVTGGEPALQLTPTLVSLLHQAGKEVAVETNGTLPLPDTVDWVTVSPKSDFVGRAGIPVLTRANEVKTVFGEQPPADDPACGITADHYFLQPCDTGDARRNQDITARCIEYIKQHPQWRLSLQMHKMVGIR